MPVDLPETINELLRITGSITVQQMENEGRVDAAPLDDYDLFEIVESITDASCDLCIEMDGMRISRDDPDFEIIKDPAHINCFRLLEAIGRDEVGPDDKPIEPDYERPSDELIDKHGHFMRFPEKYEALKVPAQPEGRDFIAKPYVGEDGKQHVMLHWRVPEWFTL